MRCFNFVSLTEEQVNIVGHYEGLREQLRAVSVQLTVVLPVGQGQLCFLRNAGAPVFTPGNEHPLLCKTLQFGVRTYRSRNVSEGTEGILFLPLKDSSGFCFGVLALRRLLQLPISADGFGQDRLIEAFCRWLVEKQQVQQAKQKIMERFGLDEATAYQILQKEAMNKRCSLVDVAKVIV